MRFQTKDSELHLHPCSRCDRPTECFGALEPNDDGWPVVRCLVYHLDGGQIDPDFLCDECIELACEEDTP